MNTATQLLERCRDILTIGSSIHTDIEAYLAKQQTLASTKVDIHTDTWRTDGGVEIVLGEDLAKQQVEQGPKSEFQRGYDLAISTTKQHVRHLNDELARYQEQHSKMMKQEPVAIVLNTGTKQGVKWLKDLEHGVHLYTSRY